MKAVLGATGHLGNVLVRNLLAKGEKVRAVIPIGEDLAPIRELNAEIVYADLRDENSLRVAFEGANVVFHTAGAISISQGDKKFLYEINVRGTENVINACKRAGVKRLVYASSVHALEEPPHGTVLDESFPFSPEKVLGDYAKSKAEASLRVFEETQKGFDAVMLCPSGIIGPYDFKTSQIAQLIMDFVSGRLKTYISGAYDFVDVRDVANGFIAAAEKAEKGEVFILSGERVTMERFLTLLEKFTGVKKPPVKMPYWLAVATAPLTPIYYHFSKTKPLFTPYSVRVLRSNSYISSDKARKELGFNPRPAEESIRDTVSWLKENSFIKF